MSAYVKLYCKKSRLKKNGEAPIYYVIKLNGKEKLLFSGVSRQHNLDQLDKKLEEGFLT